MNYVLLVGLVIVGGWDLWLVYSKQATLSQQYQKKFATWFDMILFVLGIVAVCVVHYYFPVIDFTILAIILAFWGHITFPNKETYGK